MSDHCPPVHASAHTPADVTKEGAACSQDRDAAPVTDAHRVDVLEEGAALCWQVHLLRAEPGRLPGIVMVCGIGAACVWLMFGAWLPALAALLLLVGSVSEYLFPITYRLTPGGVTQESLTTRIVLPWSAIRRCRVGRRGILLTSLAVPSRLDAFRGILLRCAPDGQAGNQADVLALLAVYAPHLPGT